MCFIFTDERNEIKASLRFKQNWHSDYKRPTTTKYKIFAAEVEKGVSHSNRKPFPSFLQFENFKITTVFISQMNFDKLTPVLVVRCTVTLKIMELLIAIIV